MKRSRLGLALTLALAGVASMAVSGTLPATVESDLACVDLQRSQNHARAFLALIDAGQYEAAWESGTEHYRTQQKREDWLKLGRDLLAPAGKPRERSLLAFNQARAATPHEGTRLAVFDYAVMTSDGALHSERLVVGALPAHECGVVRYQIDARRMAMTRLLNTFVANLNRSGGRFDFTDASLIEIERVLMEHAPNGAPRAKLTKGADYRFFVHSLGQYLGEVLVRQHNGHWSHTPSPANPVPPLVVVSQGRRIDAYQMVADYARQPAIGTLRQAVERELAGLALQP